VGLGFEREENCLVSWKKVCEPREVGGLGILDLRLINTALLGKWIWRLCSDNGGLSKEIPEYKYGGWKNLKESRIYNKDSLWWRDLKGIWSMEEWGRNFEECVEWDVGNGKNVLLWVDVWVDNEELKSRFLRLFSLSTSKDANLESLGIGIMILGSGT